MIIKVESLNTQVVMNTYTREAFTNTKNSAKIAHNSKLTPGMSIGTSGSRAMKKRVKKSFDTVPCSQNLLKKFVCPHKTYQNYSSLILIPI
jgi:nicotinamide mononucleotide adenylyltransferase